MVLCVCVSVCVWKILIIKKLLIVVHVDGVKLCLNCDHEQAFFIPQVIYEYGEPWQNDFVMRKLKNLEENLCQRHSVYHKSHMDWSLHGDRLATNSLSHSMVKKLLTTHYTQNQFKFVVCKCVWTFWWSVNKLHYLFWDPCILNWILWIYTRGALRSLIRCERLTNITPCIRRYYHASCQCVPCSHHGFSVLLYHYV
jgi:hypothetical protein